MMRQVICRRLLLVAGLVLGLTACTRDPEAAKQRYLDSGNKYFEEGKYKEASILYRRALHEDRRFGEAYYRLGVTSLKLNNPRGAASALLRAVELEPDNLDAFTKLAELHLISLPRAVTARDEKTLDSLIRITERVAAKHPDSFEVLHIQGRIALYQKAGDQAVELLRRALDVKPHEPGASVALALALAMSGQLEEAEKVIREAIEHNKKAAGLYDFLYFGYVRLGQSEKALEVLKDKCESIPDLPAAWLSLANHYRWEGEQAEMNAALNHLLCNRGLFPDARLDVGDFHLMGGRGDLALPHYEAGLEEDPGRERDYLYRVIEAHARNGEIGEATGVVERMLASDPEDKAAVGLRGVLRLRSGKPEQAKQALEDLQAAVAAAPENIFLQYHLGQAYLQSGDTATAKARFRELIYRAPDYLEARYALMNLLLGNGEFAPAEVMANEILEKRPYDSGAMLRRAVAQIGLGEYSRARAGLELLVQKKQQVDDATYQLGRLDLIEKKFASAEKRFSKLAQADPANRRALQGLIDTQLLRGEAGRAQEILDAEIRTAPQRLDLRLVAANVALLRGDRGRAAEELRFILARDPGHGAANTRLGEIQLANGDTETARLHFREAMEADPPVPNASYHLGALLAREGRFDEARPYFERCIELEPEHHAALNNLAYVLAETGTELEQALTFAQRAVARMPENADYIDTLGYVYLKRNLNENAIQEFRGIVDKNPRNASFRYHLGLAYCQKGDSESARIELKMALQNDPPEKEAARIRKLLTSMPE